ncbi:MAG: tetratricopeptide repeat protein [Nitrospirae bacterium]|nr:tetratricopeptide repeat protein [Nitrospirota bacterium]
MDQKKGQDKPLSPEIIKLTEKLANDPKSRLFVPLAEEYLKAGMPDEAMMVLTDGLKVHPNFHAARGVLGKVYLEKGQIAEAKAEFEQVLKSDPENLLAHRKLAKLYKDAGQTDKARISCQAVLLSSPKDAEMKLMVGELDRIEQEERKKMEERSAVSLGSESVEMQLEQTSHAGPDIKSEPERMEAPSPEVPPAAMSAPESAPATLEPSTPSPSLEEILGGPSPDTPEAPASSEAEAPRSTEPSPDDMPSAPPPPTEEITTEALADLYIKQGHYEKGIAIYRRLLAKDPNNQALFQKLEETVELARLLNEGPQIKNDLKPTSEIPPAPPVPPPAASSGPPAVEDAPVADRERQKMQKIQRLQLWLNSIKKGQDR